MASLLPQAKSNENENKESKEFFNFGEMSPQAGCFCSDDNTADQNIIVAVPIQPCLVNGKCTFFILLIIDLQKKKDEIPRLKKSVIYHFMSQLWLIS